ncbi:hypothetical protein E2C01_047651 [Portunus trituberculatus]|uniref:CCHC-type domain-containing protein n=1 Tax=Portunus trituberculatus TaxID=210409 RepID=A0A5B7G468_PORTR|nr:hypothetical protein [Portunus trituberculatus]
MQKEQPKFGQQLDMCRWWSWECRIKTAHQEIKDADYKARKRAVSEADNFKGACWYCEKVGHKKDDCYKRKREQDDDMRQKTEEAQIAKEIPRLIMFLIKFCLYIDVYVERHCVIHWGEARLAPAPMQQVGRARVLYSIIVKLWLLYYETKVTKEIL